MKIIFNNFLIETDEIQAISPLYTEQLWKVINRYQDETNGVKYSFKIFLLNKLEPLEISVSNTLTPPVEHKDMKVAYQTLVDIWKDKQDKFLTI
jgi:hypothetical protein